jgi:hypothetical protein
MFGQNEAKADPNQGAAKDAHKGNRCDQDGAQKYSLEPDYLASSMIKLVMGTG